MGGGGVHKASLSLAGLRIDERGGIYLNPLLDSNNAYFKCYVAQESSSGLLVGYVLFFNTLDERAGHAGLGAGPGAGAGAGGATDDPVAVIEDLYVRPRFRGRGVGTQLFRRVLKVNMLDNCMYGIVDLLLHERSSTYGVARRVRAY